MENETKPQAGSAEAQDGASGAPAPKAKTKSKRGIVIGVIVAVIVVAGVGAWVWHEQPSFCNAICHTPMSGYLETYEATPGQSSTDKWGNQVADSKGMLSAVHRTNSSNATCLSCHQPVLSQQVGEGMSWLSGNYTLISTTDNASGVLSERTSTQLSEAQGTKGDAFCLRSGCHVNSDGSVMTRADLTKLTEKTSDDPSVTIRNPHSWQHGQQECTSCHKAHRASVLTCTECHATMDVPEGWITSQEAQALTNQS